MKPYPIAYPDNIPSGLVPSKCTGCGKLWWIEPPPVDVGHCMCCKGKLRFLIAEVRSTAPCICPEGSSVSNCPSHGIDRPASTVEAPHAK